MVGFHKQMDNRIKLLEEILSFRMQGVELDNGDMYVDGHKAASDVRDEFVSVIFFSSRRRHTRFDGDWSSDVCSSDLFAPACLSAPTGATPWWRDSSGEACRPRVTGCSRCVPISAAFSGPAAAPRSTSAARASPATTGFFPYAARRPTSASAWCRTHSPLRRTCVSCSNG